MREIPVERVVVDSRQAGAGSVFVALQGEHRDGHAFIADAMARGAIAVIAEERGREMVGDTPCTVLDTRPEAAEKLPEALSLPLLLIVEDSLAALQRWAAHWRARMPAQTIGVTGSIGKTSTKELIWSVLRQRYRTLKNPGNLNNEIGLPLTLLQLTPDVERAVLEMGMYALGEIAALTAMAKPRIGVITNVGPSHLERLGTLERIAQAKSELVQGLPADGVAILNADDPLVRAMAEQTPARTFFYGLTPESDLWASEVTSRGLQGISFRLHYEGEVLKVNLPLLGRHSVHTALRAAAVGLVEGLTWQEIMEGLRGEGAQLRLMVVPGLRNSTLLDDTYNASPDSCMAALNLLSEMEGRRIAVLGDMLELGSFEEAGHRKVGCRVAETADLFVAVGRMAPIMAEEAIQCGMPPEVVYTVPDNEAAINLLKKLLVPGDFVLIKGSRGMHMEDIVAALSTGREADSASPSQVT